VLVLVRVFVIGFVLVEVLVFVDDAHKIEHEFHGENEDEHLHGFCPRSR
jgi:hypothetical protein